MKTFSWRKAPYAGLDQRRNILTGKVFLGEPEHEGVFLICSSMCSPIGKNDFPYRKMRPCINVTT
jgi:hypothetical protein